MTSSRRSAGGCWAQPHADALAGLVSASAGGGLEGAVCLDAGRGGSTAQVDLLGRMEEGERGRERRETNN